MPLTTIRKIVAREVLDSRGWPTVEAEIEVEGDVTASAIVPSGASTGKHEAVELRDGDMTRFAGRGVRKAVSNILSEIAPALIGADSADQRSIDRRLVELDGTANKSRLGANATLAVSCAASRVAALARRVPLIHQLADLGGASRPTPSMPLPMINILSGGLHADGALDFQDFLVICPGASSLMQSLEWTSAIWWRTKEVLAARGFKHLGVADEGGHGAPLRSNREALDVLEEAVRLAGLVSGRDVVYALDVASTHFHDPESGGYRLRSEGRVVSPGELISYLSDLTDEYPIVSIEDGQYEDGWEDWAELTQKLSKRIQLVGDDLFTTNPARLAQGIQSRAANSILIKINQIGTLTEAFDVLRQAQAVGMTTVLSARSGETEDALMSDLAVAWGAGQIKIGSITRSSRLSKYNQLLRLEEQLAVNHHSTWPGWGPLSPWKRSAA